MHKQPSNVLLENLIDKVSVVGFLLMLAAKGGRPEGVIVAILAVAELRLLIVDLELELSFVDPVANSLDQFRQVEVLGLY